MSWGERSCKLPCRNLDNRSYETCNVDCPGYVWDGITTPDTDEKAKEIFRKSFEDKEVKKITKEHQFSKYFRRNKKPKQGVIG